VKVTVYLPGADVVFLDAYASEKGLLSRSAAAHEAVELLRRSELGAAYKGAWSEWALEDEAVWDDTTSDGVR